MVLLEPLSGNVLDIYSTEREKLKFIVSAAWIWKKHIHAFDAVRHKASGEKTGICSKRREASENVESGSSDSNVFAEDMDGSIFLV